MKTTTKKIALMGIFSALVCVATMVIQIPIPATEGFINMGDAMIFIASICFGPIVGMVSGGIGSALGDLLTGYAHWAPYTLVIKGLEGLIAGLLVYGFKKRDGQFHISKIFSAIAMVVAALWMVLGYFFGGWILKGSWQVALTSVPANLIQAGGSVVIAYVILFVVNLIKRKKEFENKDTPTNDDKN